MTASVAPEPPAAPPPPEGIVSGVDGVQAGAADATAAATAAAMASPSAGAGRPGSIARPAAEARPVGRRPRATATDAWPGEVLGWFLAAFAGVALFSVTVPLAAAAYEVPVGWAFAVALGIAGALPLAMRWPWAAVAAFLAGFCGFLWLAHPAPGAPWPGAVPALVALCALLVLLALRGRTTAAVVAWAGASVCAVTALLLPGRDASTATVVATLVTSAAVSAGVLALALLARFARQRVTATIAQERRTSAAEHERRLIAEERTRIARELHDVVAHRMSIIQVQATSAPYRLEGLDERATAEFGEIAQAARAAMAEMRELLQVLREPGSSAETAPQPGFAEIGALVASVRRTGLPVDARIVTTAPVSTAVGQVAYRIVQEALSNVLKHAPGERTAVEVAGDRERLVVDVVNGPDAPTGTTGAEASASGGAAAEASGPALSAPSASADAIGGHGIIGMRERARLVGGTIEVGPTPGGGFGVHAVLPLSAVAEEWE